MFPFRSSSCSVPGFLPSLIMFSWMSLFPIYIFPEVLVQLNDVSSDVQNKLLFQNTRPKLVSVKSPSQRVIFKCLTDFKKGYSRAAIQMHNKLVLFSFFSVFRIAEYV